MSRVATGDPPSSPELTMVLAGSKPAPASSWAHINAALSELIDANRQLKMGGKAARIRAGPPRLPSRTAAHFASHRPCTSRGGWHRHSTASLATPPHRTAPAPTQYPYSLPRGAGGFAARYEAFAPLAPPRRWQIHSPTRGVRVARQALWAAHTGQAHTGQAH